MKNVQDFTDLKVWQSAHTLKLNIYHIISHLPYNEEKNLSLQIRKCAVSVTANIAEGFGRHHKRDTLQFLRISRGSLYELKDNILSCRDLKFISQEQALSILHQIHNTFKLLNGYIRYFKNLNSNYS
ncbi:MAG: four helix bundle protein [Methanobacteriota archaeon]|nr:MAG: four helix bundle protein [Euryarchaeota archaeon]